MARTYTLRRRAEQQAQTKRRIVEAAVDLHGTVGPARTTLSMIAERAGVQRHTLYSHFPDERSLFMACSGLAMERDPLPPAAPWQDIPDRAQRLRLALAALYEWYARNADLIGCVLRDAEVHALTREVSSLRIEPAMAAYHAVLGAGLTEPQRACLGLAMSYYTWRSLVREGGLSAGTAAEIMARAIGSAAGSGAAGHDPDPGSST